MRSLKLFRVLLVMGGFDAFGGSAARSLLALLFCSMLDVDLVG